MCHTHLPRSDEDLIRYGLERDVWFHVDKLSSAHVYVRIPEDASYTWENLPSELIQDCAQLTKANSIEGNKKNNVTIIWTPWSNLKVGQFSRGTDGGDKFGNLELI